MPRTPKIDNLEHLKQLGLLIKSRRKNLGITQEQLADDAGIHTRTLQRIENGQLNYSIDILIRILILLNADFGNLLNFLVQNQEDEKTA